MSYLQKYLQEIPESAPEKLILQVKYSAVPFLKMGIAQIYDSAGIALLKIFVITGWEMPSGDLKTILMDQLSKHLKESYLMLNLNEIEFAFRNYGSAVKDWGKCMNLSLFDEVMAIYLEKRYEASRIEEILRPVKTKKIECPKMSSDEIIHLSKSLWDKLKKVDLIFPGAYQALIDSKRIPKQTRREQEYYYNLSEKRMKDHENGDQNFFKNKDRTEWKKIYARKLVVADYFNSLSE